MKRAQWHVRDQAYDEVSVRRQVRLEIKGASLAPFRNRARIMSQVDTGLNENTIRPGFTLSTESCENSPYILKRRTDRDGKASGVVNQAPGPELSCPVSPAGLSFKKLKVVCGEEGLKESPYSGNSAP